MSFFRLGSLAALLSEPLVNGFTTGAAVHVTVSQLKGRKKSNTFHHSYFFHIIFSLLRFKDLFGIKIPRHKGAFKIIYVSFVKKKFSWHFFFSFSFQFVCVSSADHI